MALHPPSGRAGPVLEEMPPGPDRVLVMTVNRGFGHQHFIHSTLAKIHRVWRIIQQVRPECELELDGGIDENTGPLGVAPRADVLMRGTSIFGASQGIETAMRRLREATK